MSAIGTGMRKYVLSILMIALAAIVISMVASADDHYVSPTGDDGTGDGSVGNPWKTIVHAESQSNDGDNIILENGTYNEVPASLNTIYIDKSIDIYTRYADGSVTVKINDGSASKAFYLNEPMGGGLYNLTIEGDGDNNYLSVGIDINEGTENYTISRCTFQNIASTAIQFQENGGSRCNNGTVDRTVFIDCNRGITFQDSMNDMSVSNCYFDVNASGDGIYMGAPTETSYFYDLYIHNNTFANNDTADDEYAILLQTSNYGNGFTDFIIENNTFGTISEGWNNSAIRINDLNSGTIQYNMFYSYGSDTGDVVLVDLIQKCTNMTIRHNTFGDSVIYSGSDNYATHTLIGIAESGYDNTITNNTFYISNTTTCVKVVGGNNYNIRDNIFYTNTSTAISAYSPTSKNIIGLDITNNTIYRTNNTDGYVVFVGAESIGSYQYSFVNMSDNIAICPIDTVSINHGYYMGDVANSTIYNNKITGSWFGITLDQCENITVSYNRIHRASYGIVDASGYCNLWHNNTINWNGTAYRIIRIGKAGLRNNYNITVRDTVMNCEGIITPVEPGILVEENQTVTIIGFDYPTPNNDVEINGTLYKYSYIRFSISPSEYTFSTSISYYDNGSIIDTGNDQSVYTVLGYIINNTGYHEYRYNATISKVRWVTITYANMNLSNDYNISHTMTETERGSLQNNMDNILNSMISIMVLSVCITILVLTVDYLIKSIRRAM